jgi:cell wall-associated NlpC family hydrolase
MSNRSAVTATGGGNWARAAASGIAVLAVGLAGACAAASYVHGGSPAGAGGRGDVAAVSTAVKPCASGTCYVAVNVATVWVRSVYPRPVDKPALANPANPRGWIKAMTLAQKRWLVGKLQTQALYGTKVIVTGHPRPGWVKIAIPGQPTPKDARGYPGYVPTRQLTSTAPKSATTSAVVRTKTASLWSAWTGAGPAGSRIMEVSYGTRLPVVTSTPAYVVVKLIGGRDVAIRPGNVILHKAGTSWNATGAKLVAEAKKFLGLQYLWAGTSGFGFDCSGFTHTLYAAFGIRLPRDADRQAVHGQSVAADSLQPGDLVFFRSSSTGPIIHVGMYVGSGNMIDAPHTGAPVRIESVWTFGNYAGARRYLPGSG